MKINKKTSLIIVINLIFLLFVSEWIVISIGLTNNTNDISTNSVTINIDGFDAFTKGEIDPFITDEKGADELTFNYSDGSSEIITGWYYLSLDDYGNCSDFEFSVSLDLDYSSNLKFGQIMFIFGGYYDSQNQTVSYDISPVTQNETSLLMIGINDTVDNGYYVKGEVYPNDEATWGMGFFDDNDGVMQFELDVNRVGEGIEYDFSIDDGSGGGGSTPNNMHKILNYIVFVVEIHGSETSNVSARFYNMAAELQCSHLPTDFPSSSLPTVSLSLNQISIIFLSGLFIALTFVLKKRKYN